MTNSEYAANVVYKATVLFTEAENAERYSCPASGHYGLGAQAELRNEAEKLGLSSTYGSMLYPYRSDLETFSQ